MSLYGGIVNTWSGNLYAHRVTNTICKNFDGMNNLSCLFLFYVQYVATYATVGQLGDDDGVCSCTVCTYFSGSECPSSHLRTFHCFIGFCLLLHTHLPTRQSGFYLGNLLVPLYLCVQDVITDETIEQQGYEDWVCSFPNNCFYCIT